MKIFLEVLFALVVFEAIKRQFFPQEPVHVTITLSQEEEEESVDLDGDVWGGV